MRILDVGLISTPVFPNAAYELFGMDWYEWDVPRHIFVFGEKHGLSL